MNTTNDAMHMPAWFKGPAAVLQDVRRAVQPLGPQVTVQLFSSLKKSGVEEAEAVIGGWLSGEVAPALADDELGETSETDPATDKTKAPDQGT